ncbi:universal stress protein [Prauserella endophytica]|uniref:universal stress protein n=1 Tax=Prauserella endophytica TaxID=1592324 RepID=UPI000D87B1E2|nr:universal stress protein [Prauserella endophytica]PXY30106.1 hypothetical protein BAY59_12865 [Prauserella coralliicola]
MVGVDGSAAALAAVRWTAFEAARTGAALRLTHVCDVPPLDPRVAPEPAAARELVHGARCPVAVVRPRRWSDPLWTLL